jgi:hypothetical protein
MPSHVHLQETGACLADLACCLALGETTSPLDCARLTSWQPPCRGRRRAAQVRDSADSVGGRGRQVKHLVTVETDEQFRVRRDAELAAAAPRPPVRVAHAQPAPRPRRAPGARPQPARGARGGAGAPAPGSERRSAAPPRTQSLGAGDLDA